MISYWCAQLQAIQLTLLLQAAPVALVAGAGQHDAAIQSRVIAAAAEPALLQAAACAAGVIRPDLHCLLGCGDQQAQVGTHGKQ